MKLRFALFSLTILIGVSTYASLTHAADVTLDSWSETLAPFGSGVMLVPTLTNGKVVCLIANTTNSTAISSATIGGVNLTLVSTMSIGGAPGGIMYASNVPSGLQTMSWNGGVDAYFDCWFLNNAGPMNNYNVTAGATASMVTTAPTFVIGIDRDFNVSVTSSNNLTNKSNGSSYRWVDSGGMVAAGTVSNTWNATSADTAIVGFEAFSSDSATPTPTSQVNIQNGKIFINNGRFIITP